MVSNFELILRLLLSALVGGLIGLEREANNRPAGFRTHILVSIGSALIMLISSQAFIGLGENYDPARLAAQVVSGIGFLGAGTIIRDGSNIKGLTTAASIWVCGGLGLAIGAGYYVGGLVTAGITYASLTLLTKIEQTVLSKKYKRVTVLCHERPGLIGDLGQAFGQNNIMIKDIKVNRNNVSYDLLLNTGDAIGEVEGVIELVFSLVMDKGFNLEDFNLLMLDIDGVAEVEWKM